MKVLQINSVCGYGSTGGIVLDLAHAIKKEGGECYVAYGQLSSSYPHSFKIGSRLENHLHNVFSRLTCKQGYYTKNGTKKLVRYIEEIHPDVIHLHNLHGNYLNFKILFEYLSRIDVHVCWTLHDCWAFTGKCAHYTDVNCEKWKSGCHDCSQLNKYPQSLIIDNSSKVYSDKKKWFTSIKNMTIITVSKWLEQQVNQSFLAKYPIIPIYNWVDTSVFKPLKKDLREKYGIDKNKIIILVVSSRWTKEDGKLNDLIQLSKLVSDEMQIIMVGQLMEKRSIPSNIIYISYMHNKNELAKLYSMADVYVHLSVEDTFGKVIAEALACGTPVIVYNSSACPEIVMEGCGYVVQKRNVTAIFEALRHIMDNGKDRYSSKCIAHVNENFNSLKNLQKTIQLY